MAFFSAWRSRRSVSAVQVRNKALIFEIHSSIGFELRRVSWQMFQPRPGGFNQRLRPRGKMKADAVAPDLIARLQSGQSRTT